MAKQYKSFILSTFITLLIVMILIISGPIAEAVKLIITADKTQVRAGDASENQITFTTWINISNPDAFIPMQRVFLNLSGNSTRSFSFDMNGLNKQGEAFSNEITVTAGNDSFGSSNFGTGYGYDFNTGGAVDFGSGYGYGNLTSLNRTFIVTLNTSRIFDGSYTATPSLYAAGSSTTYSFTTSPISFTVLPRIITTSVPSIIGINETSSGVISTPVGDFEYIVATNSTAPPVTINVTVSVAPPSDATNISSTFAGAISDVYFNVSVNNSAWFNNVSHVQFRAFYNESKVPSNVAESTFRESRFTSSSWVRLDCAELGGCNATLADGTILYAAGVNTTGNYVYANLSHFSTFAVAGTVAAAAAAAGGNGGGGGGGVTTSEPYTNIEKSERYARSLIANTSVTYTFVAPELGIYEIAVTGKENENDIALRVEALKTTSKMVTAQPPGTVYKNVNVWAGTKRIKEALIRFRVENNWLGSNNVAGSDVKMVKWDGSQWVQIETAEKTKDGTYTYFEAKTDTFSIFAITGLKGVVVPTATPAVEETILPTPTEAATPTALPPEKAVEFKDILSMTTVVLGVIIIILAAIYLFKLKRR